MLIVVFFVCTCMACRPRTLCEKLTKRPRTFWHCDDLFPVLGRFNLVNAVILAYRVTWYDNWVVLGLVRISVCVRVCVLLRRMQQGRGSV